MSIEKEPLSLQTKEVKSNANHVSSNTVRGLAAPPYNLKEKKDVNGTNDPMDLVGNYVEPNEILVPSSASSTEKFHYYQSILQTVGQNMKMKPGSTHILGLRGVIKDKAGNIIQTSSAAQYQMALHGIGKLENQHHFSDSNTARQSPQRILDTKNSEGTWNDMIIVLAVDENSNKTATERIGSLDPSKTGDSWGTAHLMDGTYEYGLGKHRSNIPAHVKEIEKLANDQSYMKHFDLWMSGKKHAYNALVPKGKLHVLRDGQIKKKGLNYADQAESNGFFTKKDIQKYQQNKKKHRSKYFSPSIATNGHMGGKNESFSEGCWNLPREQFIQLMLELKKQQEISGKSQAKFRTKFTILDASKVGFKLIKTENEKPKMSERTDYSEALEYIENISSW